MKGASSHKTWVARLDAATIDARRQLLPSSPVLAQEYVPGKDVRVHVVGDRCFAESIESLRVDYRTDRAATHAQILLPVPIAEACVGLTSEVGLCLSGIDFRVDSEAWRFLEINPLPDLWAYDRRAGGAIIAAMCDWLGG